MSVTSLVAAGAVVGAVTFGAAPPAASGPRAHPANSDAAIDRPAVPTTGPGDVAVNVKRDFGAVGDGRADDTAAIQRAISAGLGFGNPAKIVYFPSGTYRITKPLEWRKADGTWSTWLTLIGQNRDDTVLRLADGATGFGDASSPRSMIVTSSQNPIASDGSGNQAFHNFISDLTIDVGKRNAGANGIDLMVNNRGALRNVVVRASAGSGATGVVMTRRWPGPLLIEDVRIEGFRRGMALGYSEYSVTIDRLRLVGQTDVGIENNGNVVSIQALRSENAVPAVRNDQPGGSSGLLTLVDSTLAGGRAGAAAVENNAGAFLRNVQVTGYTMAVRDRGAPIYLKDPGEWSSSPAIAQLGAPTTSLQLESRNPPALPVFASSEWAGVKAAGARPGDMGDDTAAVQAALDSGKPYIYFGPGRYLIGRPLRVPGTVRHIAGFDATINATTQAFAGGSTAAVFVVADPGSAPLTATQLYFETPTTVVDFERSGGRALDLQDIHLSGVPFRGGPGDLYLSDVEGGEGWSLGPGQRVWARQLNVERPGVQVRNAGATLRVLGIKTERAATAVESTNGARTEILGGLLYPASPVDASTPAFRSVDSAQSLTFAVSGSDPARIYPVLVSSSLNGQTATVALRDGQRRGSAAAIALYRVGT